MATIRSVICKDGKIFINDCQTNLPKEYKNIKVTQINNKVYVNGFELMEDHTWKRTLKAIWHWMF